MNGFKAVLGAGLVLFILCVAAIGPNNFHWPKVEASVDCYKYRDEGDKILAQVEKAVGNGGNFISSDWTRNMIMAAQLEYQRFELCQKWEK